MAATPARGPRQCHGARLLDAEVGERRGRRLRDTGDWFASRRAGSPGHLGIMKVVAEMARKSRRARSSRESTGVMRRFSVLRLSPPSAMKLVLATRSSGARRQAPPRATSEEAHVSPIPRASRRRHPRDPRTIPAGPASAIAKNDGAILSALRRREDAESARPAARGLRWRAIAIASAAFGKNTSTSGKSSRTPFHAPLGSQFGSSEMVFFSARSRSNHAGQCGRSLSSKK